MFQLRGWKCGRGVPRLLTTEEYKQAMIYVLTNLPEMDEYVQKFEDEQWRRPQPPTPKQLKNLRLNGAGHGKPNLLDWFKDYCIKHTSVLDELRILSRGCRFKVKSYDIYEVNGYRFRSESYEKKKRRLSTVNSGVLAVGEVLEYYGIIKDIIELKFDGDEDFSLVLFECHWFHPIDGVRRRDAI
nr:uncharacterized protein LOC120968387 [Aegilops tauschii subsp. strangulata]